MLRYPYAENLSRLSRAISTKGTDTNNRHRGLGRVGAGVANLAIRDPIAMTAAHRALDDAFAGRFVPGLPTPSGPR